MSPRRPATTARSITRPRTRPERTPGIAAWRRRYHSVNFAFVMTEMIEGMLPMRLPVVSLLLTLLLQMVWVLRHAWNAKRNQRERNAPG